jgi:hypothetical protein
MILKDLKDFRPANLHLSDIVHCKQGFASAAVYISPSYVLQCLLTCLRSS